LIGRRFRLAHVYFSAGKYIEVSTFRRHSEFEEEDRKPIRTPTTRSEPPPKTRCGGYNINGIFYDIADFSLVDYWGAGRPQQRVVRSIGDPDEKFVQDPVRMIRVIATRPGPDSASRKTYRP